METNSKIKFFIFLVCATLFSMQCFSQRISRESPVVNKAKNIIKAAAPIVKNGYQRIEKRSGTLRAISSLVAEANPVMDKAIPIIKNGFKIGKKVILILKKVLR